MGSYIVRRLLQAVLIIVVVSVIVFLLVRLIPGDPLLLFVTSSQLDHFTPEDIDKLRSDMGLDRPLAVQYFNWVSDVFQGDFGKSIYQNQKVSALLAQRLPVTIHLGVLALLLSSFFGIAAGVACALRRGKSTDTLVTSIANFGISVPIFWLGILMIYVFGLQLRWFPVHGYTSPFTDFWLSNRQLVMPVIGMSVVAFASNTRQTRSSILEILRQDYIRTAWSKGLRERTIVIRHVLKNGLVPVITLIGIQVSHIIGGAVLIETVFNIPGMGRLMVDSVFAKDYPVIQGGILLIAAMVVLTNLVVDISYSWLDPRVQYR